MSFELGGIPEDKIVDDAGNIDPVMKATLEGVFAVTIGVDAADVTIIRVCFPSCAAEGAIAAGSVNADAARRRRRYLRRMVDGAGAEIEFKLVTTHAKILAGNTENAVLAAADVESDDPDDFARTVVGEAVKTFKDAVAAASTGGGSDDGGGFVSIEAAIQEAFEAVPALADIEVSVDTEQVVSVSAPASISPSTSPTRFPTAPTAKPTGMPSEAPTVEEEVEVPIPAIAGAVLGSLLLFFGVSCTRISMTRRNMRHKCKSFEIFDLFDADGDGVIGLQELRHVLKKVLDMNAKYLAHGGGPRLTDRQVDQVMAEIDVDDDGGIGYDEYVATLHVGRSTFSRILRENHKALEHAARNRVDIFHAFDKDGDDAISFHELRLTLLSVLKINDQWQAHGGGKFLTDGQIDDLLGELGVPHNGSLSRDDFAALRADGTSTLARIITVNMVDLKAEAELVGAFKKFDEDNSGFISTDELRKLYEHCGNDLTKDEIDAIIFEIDFDGSGQVSFAEFAELKRRDARLNELTTEHVHTSLEKTRGPLVANLAKAVAGAKRRNSAVAELQRRRTMRRADAMAALSALQGDGGGAVKKARRLFRRNKEKRGPRGNLDPIVKPEHWPTPLDKFLNISQDVWDQLETMAKEDPERNKNGIDFICPISLALMKQPTIARPIYMQANEDQATYEREYIEKWQAEHKCDPKSPKHRLRKADIRPNYKVRSLIEGFIVSCWQEEKWGTLVVPPNEDRSLVDRNVVTDLLASKAGKDAMAHAIKGEVQKQVQDRVLKHANYIDSEIAAKEERDGRVSFKDLHSAAGPSADGDASARIKEEREARKRAKKKRRKQSRRLPQQVAEEGGGEEGDEALVIE